MKKTEEIKLEWQCHNQEHGMSWNEVAELVNEVNTPFKNFWKRLHDFVENVEVADQMGEEEKDMILHVCKEKL